jgi:hypothetical protein
VPESNPPAYKNQFFEVTWPLTLRGITFRGTQLGHSDDLVLYAATPAAVNVNVISCRYENCCLGNNYTTVTETDDGEIGGLVILDTVFDRASTSTLPADGFVMDRCKFQNPITAGGDPFVSYGQTKWLVINCEWFRTIRGMIMQIPAETTIQNGVVADCRFTDVGHIASGAGEVILCESYYGDDTFSNNALIFIQMISCTGPGLALVGGGIHDNHVFIMTADTMSASIELDGSTADTYNNLLEYIEITAGMAVTGTCSNNTVRYVVALRNPIRAGSASPGDTGNFYFISPTQVLGGQDQIPPPFLDSSTPSSPSLPNVYSNLFESRHDSLLKVRLFPIQRSAN